MEENRQEVSVLQEETRELAGKPEWYETVSFQDAKAIIRANLTSAARSFIAIGFYLKHIRDQELYREDGFETIWDFAQAEYGISKSTASRYMSMNDHFSQGGNSPVIQDKYRQFNKSQLQEMLSLDEEQLERVTPADRVEDIRAMRKPREIPYVELPGQISISDFPGIEPEEAEAYEQQTAAEVQQGEVPSKPYTVTLSQLMGEDEPGETVAISQQEGSGENDSESLDSAAEMAEEDRAEKSTPGYWNPDEKGPDERWNLGDIPQAKEKHLKELAEVLIEQMRVQLLWDDRYGYLSDDVITEKMKMLSVKFNHEIPLENGVIAYGCEDIIEFARGEEDLGICSYKRFATQVRKLMENRNSDADDLMEDKEDEEELPHDSDERTVPELSDIDLLRNMLEKEKSTLEEMMKVNKVEPHPALEKMIRKKKLLVGALAGTLCDLEQPELLETEDIPEQPELPVLKNNDQRKEWLNTFRDWPIWFEVPQAAEVYYRYDLPDGCSLVICEYHYWLEWMIHYGDDPERTGTREYLLAPGYHYLEDCKSNRTTMIEKLKEIQKK